MVFLLCILGLVHSSLVLEYKLWKNYGQIVYDYSGNQRHGINGVDTSIDQYEGIFTDRGIYLGENALLKTPSNHLVLQDFYIPNPGTLIFWVYSDDSIEKGRFFCRYQHAMHFFLFRNRINASAILKYSSENTESESNSWPGKTWILISITIIYDTFTIFINNLNAAQYRKPGNYVESGSFSATHLGTDSALVNPGFGGFVAYFAITNSSNGYIDYYINEGADQCLIGICDQCDSSFIIPDLGQGCAPSSMDLNTDAYNHICEDSNPCFGSLKIKCNCPSNSCLIQNYETCACLDYNSGSYYTAACNCSAGGQGCCLVECGSCETEDKCLTCKDENSFIGETGKCECNPGFYTEGDIATNPCTKCLDECSECTNGSTCTICNDTNAEVLNGICICIEGYFKNISSGNEVCTPCGLGCSECDDFNTCKNCKSELFILENETCKCQDEYWFSQAKEDCIKCSENCKTCQTAKICNSCKDINEYINDKKACECTKGFYRNESNNCVSCDISCKTCENSNNCLSCKNSSYDFINETKCLVKCGENMQRIEESCLCKIGYKLSNSKCELSTFGMHMDVSKSNKLKLSFDEDLNNSLIESDISLELSESVTFDYNLTEINKGYYLITFVFEETISNSTKFTLKLKEPIISYFGSKLDDYEYIGALFEYIYISPILKNLYEKTKAVSKSMVTFSILSSIVSNPAASWALISNLQIIPYIPIIKSEISTNINEFCLAVGDYHIIPNIVEHVFKSGSASDPFEEAKKIGFTSSVFFINFGQIIILFIANILILPVIYILSTLNLGELKIKFKRFLKNYKYSFFIRFWIQSSLDIGFFAIIQLKSEFRSYPAEYYFNQACASIFIAAFALTIPYISYFIYIFLEKVKDSNEIEFRQKYGSLFDEFKHNGGFLSSIFYVIYFLRRLQYLVTQIFLNSLSSFQLFLNIGTSFLYLSYLVFYRPFKEKSVMVSNICAELCLICNFCIVLVIVNDYTSIKLEKLEFSFISSVYFSIFIQVLVLLYNNYLSLKKLFSKLSKNNKIDIEENEQ